MNQTMWRPVLTVALAFVFLGAPVGAEQVKSKAKAGTAKSEEQTKDVDERALTILKKANEFLAQAQQFSVTVVDGYDSVQPSGMKIEYGASRKYTIRRPTYVRIDTDQRSGNQRGFRFNGKEIAVFDSDQKVYATVEHPGTLDDAFNYTVDQLQMPIPLSQLFASTLPGMLDTTPILRYVDEQTIAGVRCNHLVGRRKAIDFQVWISQSDPPLFQRLILTYKRAEGEPDFCAQFSDWNFKPEAPDSFFAFTPPEGFEKIPFAPLTKATAQAETPESKGGTQ